MYYLCHIIIVFKKEIKTIDFNDLYMLRITAILILIELHVKLSRKFKDLFFKNNLIVVQPPDEVQEVGGGHDELDVVVPHDVVAVCGVGTDREELDPVFISKTKFYQPNNGEKVPLYLYIF